MPQFHLSAATTENIAAVVAIQDGRNSLAPGVEDALTAVLDGLTQYESAAAFFELRRLVTWLSTDPATVARARELRKVAGTPDAPSNVVFDADRDGWRGWWRLQHGFSWRPIVQANTQEECEQAMMTADVTGGHFLALPAVVDANATGAK